MFLQYRLWHHFTIISLSNYGIQCSYTLYTIISCESISFLSSTSHLTLFQTNNIYLWSHRVILPVSTYWLRDIDQCDVTWWRLILIKTISSVLKVLTCIINSMTAHPIWPGKILVIMSVSTLTTDVILYVL